MSLKASSRVWRTTAPVPERFVLRPPANTSMTLDDAPDSNGIVIRYRPPVVLTEEQRAAARKRAIYGY